MRTIITLALTIMLVLSLSGIALAFKPVDLVTGEEKGKLEELGEIDINVSVKINQGRLISTIEKVRRDMFKLTHEELKEMGYRGSMSDFATEFAAEVNELKLEVRIQLQNETSNLTKKIVKEMTERRLAEIRETLLVNLTVTDEELEEEVENETENETEGATIKETAKQLMPYMNENFKKRFYVTLKYGLPEEKKELMAQLTAIAETTPEEVEVEIEIENIRTELEEEESLEEEREELEKEESMET